MFPLQLSSSQSIRCLARGHDRWRSEANPFVNRVRQMLRLRKREQSSLRSPTDGAESVLDGFPSSGDYETALRVDFSVAEI